MKPTLLVAEGDSELRDIYGEFLAGSYDVQTAADGLDCIEKLRRLMPTVLVLDRELRWGGGDGVLAWMREQDALGRASVVLTATAGLVDGGSLRRAPVVKFLTKPFTLMALLESVNAAAAGNSQEEQFYLNRHPSGRCCATDGKEEGHDSAWCFTDPALAPNRRKSGW
jgi:CheY-like chemotaxis protein